MLRGFLFDVSGLIDPLVGMSCYFSKVMKNSWFSWRKREHSSDINNNYYSNSTAEKIRRLMHVNTLRLHDTVVSFSIYYVWIMREVYGINID